jgi:hypothetical protein
MEYILTILRVNKNLWYSSFLDIREVVMKEEEIRQFVGVPIEASVMGSRMVIRGVFQEVKDRYIKFSSIEDLFVLVHGRRLSIKLMLAGSFMDLEALLKNLSFPCGIFDRCRRLKI